MKWMLYSSLVFLLSLILYALPVRSEGDDGGEAAVVKKKNECLLIAKDCGSSIQSIQDKIEKLKEEIAKGTVVYTAEELKILKQKLAEINRILDFLGNR